MPILDIQERFRELGRIRTGARQSYTDRNGNERTRPVKLAAFRITTKWRHLLDDLQPLVGGDVRPWEHPQEGAQFELIVETAELPAALPPGEVLSQWYELWSGGGIQRRCDGYRQTTKDAACACPADPEERRALAGEGKACKPTTRLNVLLPAASDLGVWRLESHGYNAAVELAGATALTEVATRNGVIVPVVLRLEARTRIRDGKTYRFAVPVVSFPAKLGDTLDALGMTRPDGLPVATGVEPRPAITTGGTPELPAAPSPDLTPEAAVEAAHVPPTPLDEPAAFTPDDAVGADTPQGAADRWPNMAAMRAKDAGITHDDDRHALWRLVAGRPARAADLTPDERSAAMELIVSIARGDLALAATEGDDPTYVILRKNRGGIHLGPNVPAATILAPASHAGRTVILDEAAATATVERADVIDVPPVEDVAPPEASAGTAPPAEATAPSAEGITQDAFRAELRRRKTRVADALRAAHDVTIEAGQGEANAPKTIGELVDNPNLTDAVLARLPEATP